MGQQSDGIELHYVKDEQMMLMSDFEMQSAMFDSPEKVYQTHSILVILELIPNLRDDFYLSQFYVSS